MADIKYEIKEELGVLSENAKIMLMKKFTIVANEKVYHYDCGQ